MRAAADLARPDGGQIIGIGVDSWAVDYALLSADGGAEIAPTDNVAVQQSDGNAYVRLSYRPAHGCPSTGIGRPAGGFTGAPAVVSANGTVSVFVRGTSTNQIYENSDTAGTWSAGHPWAALLPALRQQRRSQHGSAHSVRARHRQRRLVPDLLQRRMGDLLVRDRGSVLGAPATVPPSARGDRRVRRGNQPGALREQAHRRHLVELVIGEQHADGQPPRSVV
ncbi:MAG: hypothetical protein M3N95_04640 [Actinomycetota bacterium]|nr:hypothetical protein [Actinomycetota bacterium]